jgi:hypothetical protein
MAKILMEKKVDMSRPKEDNKPMEMGEMPEGEKYPYGLRICLNQEELDKLGIPGLPDVGEKLCIEADVTVVAIRSNETQGGGKESTVDLQITALMFCSPEEEKKEATEVLYGQQA